VLNKLTDGQMDMTKRIGAFRYYANAQKKMKSEFYLFMQKSVVEVEYNGEVETAI